MRKLTILLQGYQETGDEIMQLYQSACRHGYALENLVNINLKFKKYDYEKPQTTGRLKISNTWEKYVVAQATGRPNDDNL